MNLALTDEELAFRDEMRTFFRTQIPADIREAYAHGEELGRDRMVEAQQILNAHGLAVPHWPVEWGGRDWTRSSTTSGSTNCSLRRFPNLWRSTQHGRSGHRGLRLAGAEGEVPSGDCEPRHLVVPGILRTRGRFRSRFAQDPCGPRRRRLGHQWSEDLDDAGTVRRLDLLPRAHQSRCAQASGRHLVHPCRSEDAWRHGPPDQADRRRLRGQRSVLRGRPRSGREPGRSREPGWGYAKFLLGNERTGVTRVGFSKVRLAQAKARAAEVKVGNGTLLEDPLFAARLAELENELLALELTQLRVVASSADGQPNPASSLLKLRGSELQQASVELLMDVAGPDSLPYDAGSDIASASWAQHTAPTYLNYRKVSIYSGSSEVQRSIIASSILGL